MNLESPLETTSGHHLARATDGCEEDMSGDRQPIAVRGFIRWCPGVYDPMARSIRKKDTEATLLRAEFTVEPWKDGDRGSHGQAALRCVEESGLEWDDGPFGTRVEGGDDEVSAAVAEVIRSSMAAGATRISLQVSRIDI